MGACKSWMDLVWVTKAHSQVLPADCSPVNRALPPPSLLLQLLLSTHFNQVGWSPAAHRLIFSCSVRTQPRKKHKDLVPRDLYRTADHRGHDCLAKARTALLGSPLNYCRYRRRSRSPYTYSDAMQKTSPTLSFKATEETQSQDAPSQFSALSAQCNSYRAAAKETREERDREKGHVVPLPSSLTPVSMSHILPTMGDAMSEAPAPCLARIVPGSISSAWGQRAWKP